MAETSCADLTEEQELFLNDLIEGLGKEQKSLPCKYFYDQKGSQLFDRICELDEYYPTRTELAILENNISEIVYDIGPQGVLIEYGSGSSVKTRFLLDHVIDLSAYVPIDISEDHLLQACQELQESYPKLPIIPVAADFTEHIELPELPFHRHKVIFFPGSTIGNFTPDGAVKLLSRMYEVCGPDGGVIIGVDLKKETEVLEAAYDDAEGVTGQFNMNLLERANNELSADFDLESFEHRAVYNEQHGRVEMHLVSTSTQDVNVCGHEFSFKAGESIHTENSHKFDLDQFARIAGQAHFDVEQVWLDEQKLFSVQFLRGRG